MLKKFWRSIIVQITIAYATLTNTRIIICPGGIGDTVFVCMCLKTLRLKDNKHNIIVCKRFQKNLVQSFIDNKRESVWISDRIMYSFMFCINELGYQSFSNTYIYAHINELNIEKYDSIVDRYAAILGLNSPIEVNYPNITTIQKEKKESPYVIIAPYANSNDILLPSVFWEDLVSKFNINGIVVYTNCGGDTEKEIVGSIRLNASLVDLYSIASGAKAIVAVRSGLCDWLALSSSNLFVINDPKWGKEWDLNNFSFNPVKYYSYNQVELDGMSNEIVSEVLNY